MGKNKVTDTGASQIFVGPDCPAGSYPLGIDKNGQTQGCAIPAGASALPENNITPWDTVIPLLFIFLVVFAAGVMFRVSMKPRR